LTQTLEASGSGSDPRPSFDGDWAKADGKARQAHMTRVAAWKARHPEASSQGAKASRDPALAQAQSQAEERAAHLSTLQAVIDEPGALASDRIRAIEARERILSKASEEAQLQVHGPLVALGDALRALPMADRVGALDALLVVQA
jgi:hypothetical protein